jgi:amino acid transporter
MPSSPTVDVTPAAAPAPLSELRADCLNFWEVLAQSIAMIGPTITPVLIIPIMYAQAGDAGWLAYVFGAVTIGAVALNLNVFARRSASAGSLYVFAQRAYGSSGALLVGWCLLWAYVFVALAGTMAFTVFFVGLTGAAKIPLPPPTGVLVCTAIAWFLSYRDVRVSTIALLVLEAISLTLISILIVLIFAHHAGSWVDPAQLALHGATPSSLALGVVVAIFSLIGFESATSLGEEAKLPLITIPRAVIASVIIASVFFVVTMYAEVLGLRGASTTLDKLTTPLDNLSDSVGAPFMKIPIDIGAVLCSLSITTAALNGSARALMMMGRNHLLPDAFARTHPTHETPYIALGTIAAILAVVGSAAILLGRAPSDAFSDTSTLCAFGFVIVYGAIALGASLYLRRRGELRPVNVVVSTVAVVLLIVPAVGSVYPVPPPPGNWYPYAFVLYVVCGLALLWRRRRSAAPESLAGAPAG